MSPRWNWDSPTPLAASDCALPPVPQGGGAHSPAAKGVGESQLQRLEKRLALCLLCGYRPASFTKLLDEMVYVYLITRDKARRASLSRIKMTAPTSQDLLFTTFRPPLPSSSPRLSVHSVPARKIPTFY
jgi:hypothetical protein